MVNNSHGRCPGKINETEGSMRSPKQTYTHKQMWSVLVSGLDREITVEETYLVSSKSRKEAKLIAIQLAANNGIANGTVRRVCLAY